MCLLGVIVDNQLSWSSQVNSVISKVSQKIGILRRNIHQLSDKCEDAFFSANERSKGEGKGKEEEGKERGGKGEREREIGSEALAETEKIANAPAGNHQLSPSARRLFYLAVIQPDLEYAATTACPLLCVIASVLCGGGQCAVLPGRIGKQKLPPFWKTIV